MAGIFILASSRAFACAVCGGGKAPNDGAYIDMTMVMSLLPLCLIGGMGLLVWLRLRGTDETDNSPARTREIKRGPLEPPERA